MVVPVVPPGVTVVVLGDFPVVGERPPMLELSIDQVMNRPGISRPAFLVVAVRVNGVPDATELSGAGATDTLVAGTAVTVIE